MQMFIQAMERGGYKLIRYLQKKKKLLVQDIRCPKCRRQMTLTKTKSTKDGYRWTCQRRRHGYISRTIRIGSIFENSHIPLSSWLKIIHSFAQGMKRRHIDIIEDNTVGSSASITKVYIQLRQCCTSATQRLQKRKKMKIGAGNAFVVIDESMFCHKRKYNCGRFGRTWRRRSWVFGMLQVNRQRRRPVLKLVSSTSRRRLMPIIRKYVVDGAKILSDSWRLYRTLQGYGYIHYQVNHQRFFIHPRTGAHTQHIERAWRLYKETIYRCRGNLNEESLKDSLKLIEWNYWLGKDHRNGTLGRLLHDMRKSNIV